MRKSNALAMMTMLAMANDGFRHDFNNETVELKNNRLIFLQCVGK